jgi:hypothetical protein
LGILRESSISLCQLQSGFTAQVSASPALCITGNVVTPSTADDCRAIWRKSLKIYERNADTLPICQLYFDATQEIGQFCGSMRPIGQQSRLIRVFPLSGFMARLSITRDGG